MFFADSMPSGAMARSIPAGGGDAPYELACSSCFSDFGMPRTSIEPPASMILRIVSQLIGEAGSSPGFVGGV
jgi:hypothetical protein